VAVLSSDGARDLVFASDDAAVELESLQVDLGQGPAVDVGVGGTPVLVDDLLADDASASWWPFFGSAAAALQVRGLYAFPLTVGGVLLGTLALHRRMAGSLDPAQFSAAVLLSDAMAVSILDLGPRRTGDGRGDGRMGDGSSEVTDLEHRFPSAPVHQAAGMVMVQVDGTIEDAMARLRAVAFVEGRSLHQVARDVVSEGRRFSKDGG
jgi:hypothetical protein